MFITFVCLKSDSIQQWVLCIDYVPLKTSITLVLSKDAEIDISAFIAIGSWDWVKQTHIFLSFWSFENVHWSKSCCDQTVFAGGEYVHTTGRWDRRQGVKNKWHLLKELEENAERMAVREGYSIEDIKGNEKGVKKVSKILPHSLKGILPLPAIITLNYQLEAIHSEVGKPTG